MRLIFACDWKRRPRIMMEVDEPTLQLITQYLGENPPWVVLDGQPIGDCKVELKLAEGWRIQHLPPKILPDGGEKAICHCDVDVTDPRCITYEPLDLNQ